MQEVTLFRDETIALLNSRSKSISTAEIADELQVSIAWVNAFARGDIANPGVNTVDTLNAYLKKKAKAKN